MCFAQYLSTDLHGAPLSPVLIQPALISLLLAQQLIVDRSSWSRIQPASFFSPAKLLVMKHLCKRVLDLGGKGRVCEQALLGRRKLMPSYMEHPFGGSGDLGAAVAQSLQRALQKRCLRKTRVRFSRTSPATGSSGLESGGDARATVG